MKKRMLSLLLAVCLLVGLLPMAVLADGGAGLPEGASEMPLETGVQITGIAGLENYYFDTMEHAYGAVKSILSAMAVTNNDVLGEGQLHDTSGQTAQEQFDAVYNQKTSLSGHEGAKLTWTIYGEVEIPETMNAYYLSGGRAAAWYGSDAMTIREIEIVGGNETAALYIGKEPTMPYQWWGGETDEYLSFQIKGLTIHPKANANGQRQFSVGGNFRREFDFAIEDCAVNGNIYFYFNGTSDLTVKDCTFHGNGSEQYAFFAQGHATQPLTVEFTGNTVAGYARGINIDQATAEATITGNEITPGKGYSAIQISGCKEATIEDNTVHCDGSNFLTFHANLAKNEVEGRKISVKDNTVDGSGYLIYDDIAASRNDTNNYGDINTYFALDMENNVLSRAIDTTNGVKGTNTYPSEVELEEGAVIVVQENPTLPPAILPPILSPVIPTMSGLPFTDVAESAWYYDAVEYVYDTGLMNGIGGGKFNPTGDVTRGMVATILYRMEGLPRVASDGAAWWSDARVWAMEEGISDGTNMDGKITREQLAAMLYRYANFVGADVSARGNLNRFSDAANVSGWAADAMQWAVGEGIIAGSSGRLNPKGLATRAEVAAMFMRMNERIW